MEVLEVPMDTGTFAPRFLPFVTASFRTLPFLYSEVNSYGRGIGRP